MAALKAFAALCLLLLTAASCEAPPPDPGLRVRQDPVVATRFAGAERVVVGTVARVRPAFGTNEHGDQLIISTVTLRVEESLRGNAADVVSFEIEGGTVGDLSLEVSDLPALRPGDRGVFALRRDTRGSWVPNRRSLGILLAASAPGLDLERVRRAVSAGEAP
jgi:hypothetical protein